MKEISEEQIEKEEVELGVASDGLIVR